MTFHNVYVKKGSRFIWHYNGGCAYRGVPDDCHDGKVEGHHPVHWLEDARIPLCELHHSLLQGRKKRHRKEIQVNKTLGEMKAEIESLVELWFEPINIRSYEFDKH